MKSSFHGKIVEIPGIYADNFENAEHQNARAYFLSHYHTDHIQGLHSRELLDVLIRNNVIIYSTELTAAIIDDDKNDDRIMQCVRGLKMGPNLITLPSIPGYNTPEFCLTVTLIPAGHCAGSTMFLFSTETMNILFTGDFRINNNDLPKYKLLHHNDEPIKINTLYVDTTFLNTKYDYFPKRSESVAKMLYEMKKWLNSDETNAIALHTSAKYGYEFVFNEIYKNLDVKVSVGAERWRFYSTIPHLVPGVTNEETKIHLCRKYLTNQILPLKNPLQSVQGYTKIKIKTDEIWKPTMDEEWVNRFRQPYNPAWMDYCDPYHCNDYHKLACGLNRKTMRFKWFQSACHVILNNKCAKYRGSLKYDVIETKYCMQYVKHLRSRCELECPDNLDPVCGISGFDNHVVLFRNDCAFERANCRSGLLEEYEKVDIKVCSYYLNI
ncbi:protein artemis-like [Melitaea cinxia]|uniref:protein artemis-like n=1 Tax=Melitaea cinxia TaxID=113334 RepID=UPI001E2731EB|nr:protein artemis-like [Melitaea cinxia]